MPAKDPRVHRLTNMTVKEVSMVDRAANKRTFLVVKRDTEGAVQRETSDMSGVLRADGRGGFVRVSKAELDAEEAAKAFGKPPSPPVPPGDKEPTEDEVKRAKKLLKAAGFTNVSSRFFKVDRQGIEMANHISEIASSLADCADKLRSMESEEPSDMHMGKIEAAHKSLGGFMEKYGKTAKSAPEVAAPPVGATPAFKANLESLSSLLRNYIEKPGAVAAHAPDAGDPQKPPPGFSGKNPSDAPTNASGEAAVKQLKADNAALTAELTKIRKGVAGSNSQAPGERARPTAQSTSWPVDMNARAVKDKSDSFLD